MNVKEVDCDQLSNLLDVVMNLNFETCATEGFIKHALKNDDGVFQIWTEPPLDNFSGDIAVLILTNLTNHEAFHYMSTNDQFGDELLTKWVDWSKKRFMFEGIPSRNIEYFKKKVSNYGFRVFNYGLDVFTVSAESLIVFPIPSNYKESELLDEDLDEIFENWPHNNVASRECIRWYAKNGPITAIRDDQDNLVAYELTSTYGSQSLLKTKEEHTKKGLGCYVISSLASKILKNNNYSFVLLDTNNTISLRAHLKCGFKKKENVKSYWIFLEKL